MREERIGIHPSGRQLPHEIRTTDSVKILKPHRVDRVGRGREDGKRNEEAGESADEPSNRLVDLRWAASEPSEYRWGIDACEQVVPFQDDPDRLCGRERDDDEAHGRLQEGAEGELERQTAGQEGGSGQRCRTRGVGAFGARGGEREVDPVIRGHDARRLEPVGHEREALHDAVLVASVTTSLRPAAAGSGR